MKLELMVWRLEDGKTEVLAKYRVVNLVVNKQGIQVEVR
jgi:hypothetical protein